MLNMFRLVYWGSFMGLTSMGRKPNTMAFSFQVKPKNKFIWIRQSQGTLILHLIHLVKTDTVQNVVTQKSDVQTSTERYIKTSGDRYFLLKHKEKSAILIFQLQDQRPHSDHVPHSMCTMTSIWGKGGFSPLGGGRGFPHLSIFNISQHVVVKCASKRIDHCCYISSITSKN